MTGSGRSIGTRRSRSITSERTETERSRAVDRHQVATHTIGAIRPDDDQGGACAKGLDQQRGGERADGDGDRAEALEHAERPREHVRPAPSARRG